VTQALAVGTTPAPEKQRERKYIFRKIFFKKEFCGE